MPMSKASLKCIFCGKGKCNELIYGPFCSTKKVSAHYFCILLSSKLLQNGKDDEGIFGFLIRDILNEKKRCKKIKCSFCGKNGANINCHQSKCNIVFHLPCGIRNKTVHQFTNCFLSYCSDHGNVSKCTKEEVEKWKKKSKMCGICFESIPFNLRYKCNRAPCCFDCWFHKTCLQKLANNAGYFFKCPACNNKKNFVTYMMKHGIFVPQKDASWELVPGAYQELLFKYKKCDAPICKCPMGREKNIDNSKWEIMLCETCGSQGIHVECGDLKETGMEWCCSICEVVTRKYKEQTISENKKNKLADTECSSNSSDDVKTEIKKRKSTYSHCGNSKRQKVDTMKSLQNDMNSLAVSSMNNTSHCIDSPNVSSGCRFHEEKDYVEIMLIHSDEDESCDSDIQIIKEIKPNKNNSCEDGFVKCMKKPLVKENPSLNDNSKNVLKEDKETNTSPRYFMFLNL